MIRDLPKLEGYINHIWSLIDPQHKIDRLLAISGPRELMNVRSYIQAVGEKKQHVFQCSLFYKGEKDWMNNCATAVQGPHHPTTVSLSTHTGLTS